MKKKFKRVLAVVLSLALMVTIVGCSKGTKGGSSSMGRYVEERYESPEGVSLQNITKLDDGRLGAYGYSENGENSIFISEDGGKNWGERALELPQQEGKESWINNISFLNDGRIFMSYCFMEPFPEFDENAVPEGEGTDDFSKEDFVYEEPEYKYALVDEDGTMTDVELDLSVYDDSEEGYGYSNQFKVSSNGDVFVAVGSNNNKVVQLDGETFEEKNIYEGNEWINDFFIIGDSLIIYEFDSLTEYDITNGKQKGNLESLEKETIAKDSNYYPTFINSNSKDKLYFYTVLGLYAYDMKTEKVNMLVDGAISTFGSNDIYLMSFVEKGEQEFLAAFNDWANNEVAIINYTYNPDIPSLPEEQIRIYSLIENDVVRQAISRYAKLNPDVYVKYEIGLNYGDGATESDALKTLNTEIMAGNGPDIILLDNLSAESYIEKGLLEDISDVINPYVEDGSIFKNIADAYTVDGKIYQFPTRFKFPIVVGNKDTISSVSDLNSFAEVIKELAKVDNKKALSDYYTPKSLVYALYYLYGNAWLNEDDTINEEELNTFFATVKDMYTSIEENDKKYSEYMQSIWSQNIEGGDIIIDDGFEVTPEEDFEGEELGGEEEWEDVNNVYELKYYLSPSVYADMFLMDNGISLMYGGLDRTDGYTSLITALNNDPTLDYKILTRGEESVFIPVDVVGINAKSKNKDAAKEILKELLSEEGQKGFYGSGLTVNKNALKKSFEMEKYEGYEPEFDEVTNHYINGSWATILPDGTEKEVKMLWPNEEDVNKLIGEIESLQVGATLNSVLLVEVAKQFEAFVNDEVSIDDAIKAVVDNLDLYLSE